MSKLTPTQRQILGHCQDWSAAFEVAERRVNDGAATDWRRTQDVLMSLHKRGLVEYHKGNATYRLTEAGRAALTPSPAPMGNVSTPPVNAMGNKTGGEL